MADDDLTKAAERAGAMMPGRTGKYVGMLLDWVHRTSKDDPLSVQSQIAAKLASAVLALSAAPAPTVDRDGLALFVANAISRSSEQHVPIGYRVADALIARGLVNHEPLPEWQCPKCGATTQARMADHQGHEEREHIIEVRESGWTIKHPLACRPNLFDCPINRAAEQYDVPPASPGRYVLTMHDGVLVIGEPVTDG